MSDPNWPPNSPAILQAIAGIDGLRPLKQFDKTTCRAQMRYSFFYDPGRSCSWSRDQLVAQAQRAGIPLAPGYRCVSNDVSLFRAYAAEGEFPAARAAEASVLSIHHPELLRDHEYWADRLNRLRELLPASVRR